MKQIKKSEEGDIKYPVFASLVESWTLTLSKGVDTSLEYLRLSSVACALCASERRPSQAKGGAGVACGQASQGEGVR